MCRIAWNVFWNRTFSLSPMAENVKLLKKEVDGPRAPNAVVRPWLHSQDPYTYSFKITFLVDWGRVSRPSFLAYELSILPMDVGIGIFWKDKIKSICKPGVHNFGLSVSSYLKKCLIDCFHMRKMLETKTFWWFVESVKHEKEAALWKC